MLMAEKPPRSVSIPTVARRNDESLAMCVRIIIAVVSLFVAGCGKTSDPETAAAPASEAIQRVAEKGPVKLTVRITPPEPRLSDLVEMEVQVTAEPNVEIKPPAFGAAVGDFLVRDYSERSPKTSTEDSANVRTFYYQLEPVHSGTHLIRSIAIEFFDNRETSEAKGKVALIESDPIEVKITSELSDQVPDLAQLEPMLPPQPLEDSSSWWWLGTAGLAVAAVLIATRLRRRRQDQVIPVAVKSPEEIAQAALTQLLSEELPNRGLFKEFYVRLTGIVRIYIEGKTGLKAPEQTTEEFLREIRTRDVFTADRSVRLKEFLEAADMVKYAGQQPGVDQIERSIQRAKEFITS
jgi:hypothetical protein